MWKFYYGLLLLGCILIFIGYKRNNPGQRQLGLKIAAVGLGLIVVSNMLDIRLFP